MFYLPLSQTHLHNLEQRNNSTTTKTVSTGRIPGMFVMLGNRTSQMPDEQITNCNSNYFLWFLFAVLLSV